MALDYLLIHQLMYKDPPRVLCSFVRTIQQARGAQTRMGLTIPERAALEILDEPFVTYERARGSVHLKRSSPNAWLAVDAWSGEFEAR